MALANGGFIFPAGGGRLEAMRVVISIAVFLTLGPVVIIARAETALDAIKQLPKDQAARIARIEARDGTPAPDRWYIITQDPKADNGVHEFVVSDGAIVASRSVSQFAESLTPEDMLGDEPVKIDSDKAAKVAQDYAEANGNAVTSMNYELKKDGTDGAPVWTISCMDDKGTKVGSVVVAAEKGDVVSHDGFALEPVAEATQADTPAKEEEPDHDVKPKAEEADEAPRETTKRTDTADETREAPVTSTPPAKKPSAITKTLQNVGNTLKKLDPF